MKKLNKKCCKDKLYVILSEIYERVETEKKFEWCCSFCRDNEYDKIIENIKSFRQAEFIVEKSVKLPFDYVCTKEKVIIEYDERQHFTKQRKLALEAYPETIGLAYNKKIWINLCNDINAKMNKKADPFRDEKRALYDSIRDIEAFKKGYKVIRIFHGQIDFEADNAKELLIQIIGQ